MFAGPNGSGKSTLKTVIPPNLLGIYLNPDEMEKEMKERGFLDLSAYGVSTTESDVRGFFSGSALLAKSGCRNTAECLSIADGKLNIRPAVVNSYLASVMADFFRQRLLDARVTFTFETVMSHPSKVGLLEQAQGLGYRTYLYFIATDDPEINISRVRSRSRRGGHSVPKDLIIARYHRSLKLLNQAIRHSNRAYIFDNSGDGEGKTWLAEITNGRDFEIKSERIPAWFKQAVWDRF